MQLSISSFDGSVVVRSVDIAKSFEKRHDHVMRDIDALLNSAPSDSPEVGGEYFTENQFVNGRNRKYREFLMTREGFALLAMGFTGDKAYQWKIKYLKAFKQMEDALKNQGGSLMQALSEAVAALESDMEKASQYGKALSDWKRIKQQHIEAIIEANSKTQMLINFG